MRGPGHAGYGVCVALVMLGVGRAWPSPCWVRGVRGPGHAGCRMCVTLAMLGVGRAWPWPCWVWGVRSPDYAGCGECVALTMLGAGRAWLWPSSMAPSVWGTHTPRLRSHACRTRLPTRTTALCPHTCPHVPVHPFLDLLDPMSKCKPFQALLLARHAPTHTPTRAGGRAVAGPGVCDWPGQLWGARHG